MENLVISAQQRTLFGKNANRRLRASGRIPGVVYGHGSEPVSVSVDPRDVTRILHSDAGQNTIFKIRLKDGAKDVLIRDFQLDPVKGNILHADFLLIAMDELLRVEVPIDPQGTAPGITAGGLLDLVSREIEIEALPRDLPDRIAVDISSAEIGDSIRVGDLVVDTETVKILSDPEQVVLTISAPLVEEVEEVEEPEEEEVQPEVISKGKPEEEEEEASE